MLAGDPVEAIDQAQKFLKENSLTEYYDDVLLEGIRLAGADGRKGLLEEDRAIRIKETVAEVVEDLSSYEDTKSETQAAAAGVSGLSELTKAETEPDPSTALVLPAEWHDGRVLCLPGIGHLDEAVALIVAQVLRKRGFGVRAEQADSLSMSRIFTLDTKGISAICVCYIENASAAQIAYAVRRLRRKVPQAFILIALLAGRDLAENGRDKLRQTSHADAIEVSLEGVRECLVGRAKRVSTLSSVEQNAEAALLPAAT